MSKTPSARRRVVDYINATHNISISKACNLDSISRSSYYYRSKRDDTEIVTALKELSDKLPRRGLSGCFKRLRAVGHPYDRMGLRGPARE